MAGMLTLAALAADPDCYHLVDVRDADDYAAAHVDGAALIPLAALADRAAEIPATQIPVTICQKGGSRSTEGAELLCTLLHPGALWLEGGTKGWLAATAGSLHARSARNEGLPRLALRTRDVRKRVRPVRIPQYIA